MMTTKLGIHSLVLNALSCFRPASFRGWFVYIEVLTIINSLYLLLSVSKDNLKSREDGEDDENEMFGEKDNDWSSYRAG